MLLPDVLKIVADAEDGLLLDHAASTKPLKIVMDAVDAFLRGYGSIHRGVGHNSSRSTERYEWARTVVEDHFPGMRAVFCGNTTEALNRLSLIIPATCVGTTSIEHSANLLCWLKYHKSVEMMEISDLDEVTPERLGDWLDQHREVRVFTVAAASNLTGTHLADIAGLHSVCRARGVTFVLDACQYVPHSPSDLLSADAIAFSGHKMYAPFGGGCLVANPEILADTSRSLTGGGNVEYIDPNMAVQYKPLPFNHEIGTPNAVGAIAMAVSLQAINEHIQSIIAFERRLTEHLQLIGRNLMARQEGWIVVGAKDAPVLSIGHRSIHKLRDLSGQMHALGVSHRIGNFCVHSALRGILGDDIEPRELVMIRLSGGLGTDEEKLQDLVRRLV